MLLKDHLQNLDLQHLKVLMSLHECHESRRNSWLIDYLKIILEFEKITKIKSNYTIKNM